MPQKAKWVLFAALIAVSTAAPMAKMADAHPISIGFWRTAIVGIMLMLLWNTRPSRQRLWMTAVAGVLLGLHFWLWFASLEHTTVLRSTTLVCLNPLWTGLMEWSFFNNKPGNRYWLGLSLALIGVVLMTGGTLAGKWSIGDLMAVMGGLMGSGYLIAGRVARQSISIEHYGALVCLAAASFLGLTAMALNVNLSGYSRQTWIILALMAIGPQLTGHIGINYALKTVTASAIALLLLLEPVGAAIISMLLLAEVPSYHEWMGSGIILFGVATALHQKPTSNTSTNDPL